MRTLYLLRPHGTAGIEGEQLVVRSDEQELDRMGLPLLDQILVMGKMQLTTQLIRACLQRGIPIAYLSNTGQCLGRIQPLDGGYRHRARRQAELPQERRLALARSLVAGKIANGRVVLQRLTRRSGRSAVEPCLRRLGQLHSLISCVPCPDQLRGLEGSAAALYFRSLRPRHLMHSAGLAMECSGMRCCCAWSFVGLIPTTACCMWVPLAMPRWYRI
jgi:CRISPR-associated protein Cas1